MENVIKTLDRYFEAFKDQERDWGFFMGLTDYVNLLDEIPQLKGIIEKLMEGEDKMFQSINDAEKLAVVELKALSKKILIKSAKKNEASIQEAVAMFKEFDEEKIHPEWWHSARLQQGMRNIIEAMVKEGYGDSLKKVLPKDADIEKLTLLYDICPAFSLRSALSYGFREQKDTEIWGNYRKLLIAAKTFQKGNEYLEQMKKEGKDTGEVERLLKDRELIREDGDEPTYFIGYSSSDKKRFSSSTDSRIKEFQRNKYQNYASRVHNYFIKELSKKNVITQPSKSGVSFDSERSILIVNGKEIKFRKFTEQYHSLRIMFSNKNDLPKEWFFSEIGERMDAEKDYTDKQFHNYFAAIKRRVAVEAGIKDLFITTTQSVKINENI